MPVDTRDKRTSLFGLSLPFGRVLPFRDGSVTEEDFEQFMYLYRGIQVGLPLPDTFPIIVALLKVRAALSKTLRTHQANETVHTGEANEALAAIGARHATLFTRPTLQQTVEV